MLKEAAKQIIQEQKKLRDKIFDLTQSVSELDIEDQWMAFGCIARQVMKNRIAAEHPFSDVRDNLFNVTNLLEAELIEDKLQHLADSE